MTVIPFHEEIVVQCLGLDYTGWESVQIEQSMQVAYARATLTTTEVSPPGMNGVLAEWNFPPGSLVQIFASGTLVFTGAVFQYIPSADANQHSITLVCQTLTWDFTISSVESDTGQYQNTTDARMIAEWAAAHGLKVVNLGTDKPVPVWQIKAGATKWSEALRLIQPAGKMLFADALGNLILSGGKSMRLSGSVVQGVNIEAMSALLQDVQFNTNHVVGQSPFGVDLTNHIQPQGIAIATIAGSGYRYRKIIDQSVSTSLQAAAIANWHKNRTAGNAMQATIVTPGWRDLDEHLWLINQDVYVNAPWLHIDCTLRTYRVVFMQNLQQGTVTQLTLMDPRAVMGADSPSINEGGPLPCNSDPTLWGLGWDAAEEVVTTIATGIATGISSITW